MAKTTPATRALDALGVAYDLLTYAYEAGPNIGARAAEALGVDPASMLKTLMVRVDGAPACVVTPSDGEVSLKKVASAFGGKSAVMMPPADAERLTGYVVGGISPIGQKRRSPTIINARVQSMPRIYCNGGGRGLQLALAPDDLAQVVQGRFAELDQA